MGQAKYLSVECPNQKRLFTHTSITRTCVSFIVQLFHSMRPVPGSIPLQVLPVHCSLTTESFSAVPVPGTVQYEFQLSNKYQVLLYSLFSISMDRYHYKYQVPRRAEHAQSGQPTILVHVLDLLNLLVPGTCALYKTLNPPPLLL